MIKSRVWILLFSALLLVSLGLMLFQQNQNLVHPIAKVTHNGQTIRMIDLEKAGSLTFTVEGESLYNTIQVEKGKIRVLEANCPDQICVHRGWAEKGAGPVVCLPNGLMIEIISGQSLIDGAVG